jgi:VCBS repeat-containing protein
VVDQPGSYTVQLIVNDGTVDSAPDTVTISTGNSAPTAVNDSFTVDEDAVLSISAPGVLANDSDAEGDDLTVSLVSNVSNGSLTLNADGSFTYTPDADFNGSDSFTYTVNDGAGTSTVATVTLTVTAVNDAPVALADTATVLAGESVLIAVLANDTDDGTLDVSTVTVASGPDPSKGTVAVNADGTITYTSTAAGADTDSFSYTVVDDQGVSSSAALVTVTIDAAPNEAPVAVNDSFTVDEDVVLSISAPGVLANDSDAEGDDLTVSLVSNVSNGSLTLNADGSFMYTPDADFNGSDSFTYTVYDGAGTSTVATVTLTVTGINDAPLAVADSYATNEETLTGVGAPGVLGNDSDVDGDGLTADLVSSVVNGTLTLNADGSFEYTPAPGFIGTDSFSYVANDGSAESSLATVTLTVAAIDNNTPEAIADSYTTDEDTSLNVSAPGVLGNDRKVTGKGAKTREPLTAYIVNSTVNGGLLLYADGSFEYIPDEGFEGVDSFTYKAYDGTALSNEATVTITINGVNDPPTIAGDPAAIVVPGSQYVFSPGANDADGDVLTFTAYGVPAWASFDSETGVLSGIPTEADIGVYPWIWIGVSDGVYTEWLNAFEINVVDETSTVVTLSWLPPTHNTDGSSLLDLRGYKIYYWDEYQYPNAQVSPVIELTNAGLSSYVFELPWAGFWKLAITAYNDDGTESNLSNIWPVLAN